MSYQNCACSLWHQPVAWSLMVTTMYRSKTYMVCATDFVSVSAQENHICKVSEKVKCCFHVSSRCPSMEKAWEKKLKTLKMKILKCHKCVTVWNDARQIIFRFSSWIAFVSTKFIKQLNDALCMVTSLTVIVMRRKTYLLIADTHTIIHGFFIAWTNQSVWSTDGEWWKEKTQCLFSFISKGNV